MVRRIGLMVSMIAVLGLVGAQVGCSTGAGPDGPPANDNGTTDNSNSNDSGDTGDNSNSNDNGDTADNSNSNDNGDTADNSNSNDNGDTADNSNSNDNGDSVDGVGETFILEPDDFADETILTAASPFVTLRTSLRDGRVSIFKVTATDDGFEFAPTGQRVFAHENIPFFSNVRRLRMDFSPPARMVQISFAGGEHFQPEVGLLMAFSGEGNLLAEYVTEPRAGGEVEVMTITREHADIAWALAYSEGDFTFGRLDELVYTVVTEP